MSPSYDNCMLCARKCGVNRNNGLIGYCKSGNLPTVARAALHHWEEPVISGARGSGTIFFSGCSLACVYCQNKDISRSSVGKGLTPDMISDAMLRLESDGAHNINFVTPTHFMPSVREAIILAKSKGLSVPIVYNTSSYDTPESIMALSGLVDIYLPDMKYYLGKTAAALSNAPDYPAVARNAVAEMVRQCPKPVIDEGGLMRSGVIVRVLLLPSHVAEAKLIVKYLYETYGDDIYVSLMNQYTPMPDMVPPLNRRVTHEEYGELVDYAERIGVINGFTQEFGTASESFIPPFDNTGI